MTTLVTVSSRHGATAEVARAIGASLEGAGFDVRVQALDEITDLEGVDSAVIGSAVYYGRWLPEAAEFVRAHAAGLAKVPVWLFSSGPVGDPSLIRAPEEIAEFVDLIGFREHRVFAGRIDGDELDVEEQAYTSVTPGHESDFRDWAAVRRWASGIGGELAAR